MKINTLKHVLRLVKKTLDKLSRFILWVILIVLSVVFPHVWGLRSLSRILMDTIGCKIVVLGRENLVDRCVVAFSHHTYIDPLALYSYGGHFIMNGSADWCSSPLMKPILGRLARDGIHIVRKNTTSYMSRKLDSGEINKIVISPMGGYATDISDFKCKRTGTFVAASKSNVPIIPVTIRVFRNGVPHADWSKDKALRNIWEALWEFVGEDIQVVIHYGQPYYCTGTSEEDIKEAVDKCNIAYQTGIRLINDKFLYDRHLVLGEKRK